MAEEIKVTAETIARDTMAKIEAAKKKAPEAEAKGKASLETKPKEEAPNVEEKKEVEEKADAKTTEEKVVPHKKTDEEKQESVNARMAELTAKAKKEAEEKAAIIEERDRLRREKEELVSKLTPKETPEETIKKAEDTRIAKYLEEDKSKPREQRREMSDEELDAWLVEDYRNAQRWIARNENRRERDRSLDETHATRKSNMEKFSQYMKEGVEKHPELDTTKRIQELKAMGKSEEDIKETILKENVKVRTVLEILKEHPEYLRSVEGPKLAREELEKRLEKSKSSADIKDVEKEELRARLDRLEKEKAETDAELKRRDGIDSDTKSSRRSDDKPSGKKLTEFEEAQEKIRGKAGISKERLDAIKSRRSKIPGASIRDKDDT